MIPKGITRWETEIVASTIPLNHDKPTHPALDLELSISPSNKFKKEFHIEVKLFCFVFNGEFKSNPPKNYFSNPIFQFSTSSKFRFVDPLLKDATIQFIFNCMEAAIVDFNLALSTIQSNLLEHIDGSGNNIQHPTPILSEQREFINKIWRMGDSAN